MHINNYTPWHIIIYMYVCSTDACHVKFKASKLEYIRVSHVLVHCFAHLVSTAIAYDICVFETKHLFSTDTPTRVCYSRVGVSVK